MVAGPEFPGGDDLLKNESIDPNRPDFNRRHAVEHEADSVTEAVLVESPCLRGKRQDRFVHERDEEIRRSLERDPVFLGDPVEQ